MPWDSPNLYRRLKERLRTTLDCVDREEEDALAGASSAWEWASHLVGRALVPYSLRERVRLANDCCKQATELLTAGDRSQARYYLSRALSVLECGGAPER